MKELAEFMITFLLPLILIIGYLAFRYNWKIKDL